MNIEATPLIERTLFSLQNTVIHPYAKLSKQQLLAVNLKRAKQVLGPKEIV